MWPDRVSNPGPLTMNGQTLCQEMQPEIRFLERPGDHRLRE